MQVKNIVFSAALCGVMCAPAGMLLVQRLGVDLPSWLTTEDAAYLSGGVSDANVRSVLSLDGFESGELQKAIEDEIGNYVPAKATALLTSAAIQRNLISVSNMLFGWDCYPTFFGSDILEYSEGEGRLLEAPKKESEAFFDTAEDVALGINDFAARHKNLSVSMYLAPDDVTVEDVPSMKLISDPLTYNDYRAIFLDDNNAYTWIDGEVSFEQFEDGWFVTDHHWNIKGAYDAYARIGKALGFGDELVGIGSIEEYDRPAFMGALSRLGLSSDYSDHILDVEDKLSSSLSVSINGSKGSPEDLVHKSTYESHSWNDNPFANHYADFFHTDYGLIEIENTGSSTDDSLLIVADSYSNCMERFLATHYGKTYVLDPRHFKQSLDEFLSDRPEIVDVLFLMRGTNMVSCVTSGVLLK